ncbi:hypothetical protein [Archangium violaceum]|nr:hypothetical protein [Archangium violaceum]
MSTQTRAVTPDTLRLGSPEELKHWLSFIKESDTSRGLLFNAIREVVRRRTSSPPCSAS